MTDPMQTEREAGLSQAFKHLRFGMRIAYAHGLHEAGYDPVEVVASELRSLRDALQLAKSRIAELEGELRLIAGTDPVDACLDPQRAVRAARAALKEDSE